jgi:hypothetical protein
LLLLNRGSSLRPRQWVASRRNELTIKSGAAKQFNQCRRVLAPGQVVGAMGRFGGDRYLARRRKTIPHGGNPLLDRDEK